MPDRPSIKGCFWCEGLLKESLSLADTEKEAVCDGFPRKLIAPRANDLAEEISGFRAGWFHFEL